MAGNTSAASTDVGVRRISLADLQRLLRDPLRRLGIATPSLEECANHAIWLLPGPIGPMNLPHWVSGRPARDLVALRNSISEVEAHWTRVMPDGHPAFAGHIAEPLARLRSALDEYERLIPDNPKNLERWEDAAVALALVFKWVVQRSGSNTHPGLSKGGPSMTFIMSGLRESGWASDRTPSEDAVLQFMKRYRKNRDIPV